MNDLCIYIGSVPTEHLESFDGKLQESFKRIVKEGVEMDRMTMIINRDERQVSVRLDVSARFAQFYLVSYSSNGAVLNPAAVITLQWL